ncbi:hypothetical protein [Flagellimonas flava]|uniref:Beta-lactamase-inhibitor-like, PepSY-like n=1 Tax=Flagellimonas flava TaxID=570519 RepID=A0A1M5KF93_9FLAO|nr:hypothetical protein [Allomuricauda flava]SHG51385.1 hypothetical protein SAMN04488116_1547 [Allomuricauda flava]
MMRSKRFFTFLFLCLALSTVAQNKYEKEYRIPKSEFPSNALQMVSPYLEDAKRVRFYHETDSTKKSYELKLKKGRLHYSIEFNQNGDLEDVEFLIKETDVPEESWARITDQLQSKFKKIRIKRIQQQHPAGSTGVEKVLRDAFQNLILPTINYELVFTTKGEKGYQTFEGLFSAEGQLIKLRESLSADYDHILY